MPLEVKIWDWIVTHNGEVLEIWSDDMPDLKYEDIRRHATKSEIKSAKIAKNRWERRYFIPNSLGWVFREAHRRTKGSLHIPEKYKDLLI